MPGRAGRGALGRDAAIDQSHGADGDRQQAPRRARRRRTRRPGAVDCRLRLLSARPARGDMGRPFCGRKRRKGRARRRRPRAGKGSGWVGGVTGAQTVPARGGKARGSRRSEASSPISASARWACLHRSTSMRGGRSSVRGGPRQSAGPPTAIAALRALQVRHEDVAEEAVVQEIGMWPM